MSRIIQGKVSGPRQEKEGEKKLTEDDEANGDGASAGGGGDGGERNEETTGSGAGASEEETSSSQTTLSTVSPAHINIDEEVKEMNRIFQKENSNLHRVNTSLHERNHYLSLKQAELDEVVNAEQTKNQELQNRLDDVEYELTKTRMRNGKMESCLAETQVSSWDHLKECHEPVSSNDVSIF